MGAHGDAPVLDREQSTTLQLIAVALESGEIDEDTAVEYRVYAVKAADQLPENYRGGRPMRDVTGVLRQARERYPGLRPEVQERLRPYLFPRDQ